MGTGADRLYEILAWNNALAGKITGRDFPQHAFEQLQQWQQTRLARTFEDLMQQDAYRPAITFFLTELYGGLDFRERDQEMSKVMPVMKAGDETFSSRQGAVYHVRSLRIAGREP